VAMPELQHMVLRAFGVDTASKTGGGERWVLGARREDRWVQVGDEVSHDDASAALTRLVAAGIPGADLRVRRVDR
jgi:hypothetical protein